MKQNRFSKVVLLAIVISLLFTTFSKEATATLLTDIFGHHSEFPSLPLFNLGTLSHTYKDRVVILTFHDVSSTDKSKYDISPRQFEGDIQELLTNGYHIIPLSQAINFMQNKGTVPPKAVVITSDDGYEGMYKYVFPVLKKHRIPATFFLIAGTIDHYKSSMTWKQARIMEKSGLVTFGGHSFHAHVPRLISSSTLEPATIGHIYNPITGKTESGTDFQRRMLKDSLAAQHLFQLELGHTSPYFAYPYGAYTPELDQSLKQTNYKYFFTEIPGLVYRKPGMSHICRLDLGIPNISSVQLIDDLYTWSKIKPRTYMPSRSIIHWAANTHSKKVFPFKKPMHSSLYRASAASSSTYQWSPVSPFSIL